MALSVVVHLLLYGSYVVLWAVAAVETAMLVQIIRRVVRLHAEMYEAMPAVLKEERLARGTFVDFGARDITTGAVIRSADLRGAPAALLFMGPEDLGVEPSEWLLDTIEGLRYRGDGRLLVLWDAAGDSHLELPPTVGTSLPILLDEGGEIRRRFLVSSTPTAVLLDSEAAVATYGKPESVPSSAREGR